MVTETADLIQVDDLRTCEDCGKEGLKGSRGVQLHARFCPAQLDGPENASEVVAQAAEQQPAAIIGPTSWRVDHAPPPAMPESVRDPNSRIYNNTHAWYFAPPVADVEEMLRTTGLPVDVFHSAPTWQVHQRQQQEDQGHILVTPIDAFGMKKRGSPYVHIMPPQPDVWEQIVSLWEPVIPIEVMIEQELLEQAEADLARATDATERSNARATIRILSTRVLQLQHIDFDAVLKFFYREHQYSRAGGRTDAQLLDDQIDERIESRLGGIFEEHNG